MNLSPKAYPNPVQDAVTVEILSRVAGIATFEVLDVTSRAIFGTVDHSQERQPQSTRGRLALT